MPSRPLPPPPLNPPQHQTTSLLPPLAGGVAAVVSVVVLLTIWWVRVKLTRKRTVPSDTTKPPHRFSYSALRRATSSFSPSHRIGQGGFGSVYRASLSNNQQIAVKVMDAGSLQGEREFQAELFFAAQIESDYVVSVKGFSSDRKRRHMLLVYEFMSNGSLQDCLFYRKLKQTEDQAEVCVTKELGQDNGSVVEDTESVTTASGLDEFNFCNNQSPESFVRVITVGETSPETVEASAMVEEVSPRTAVTASPGEGNFDQASVESDSGGGGRRSGKRLKKNRSVKEWWWKQDNGGGETGGVVKDYVMEWIGNEIKKERPRSEWIVGSSSGTGMVKSEKPERKKERKRLDWWTSLDEDKVLKRDKRRPAREWWKEEYCEELARKKKKKKKQGGQGTSSLDCSSRDEFWPMDKDLYIDRKKKRRSRSRSSSRTSVDWWLDGISGELWRGGGHESASGDIPKSGGVSSTPSMRGTVCYVAPEYGGNGVISEKCDVYSYGVLMLVLIAGRRPLQVTGSPMSEFRRANLISWAKQLARAGKLLDLVDQSVQCLDREQALLCITIALLCLQKSPARRPSMKEVVGMLSGELEPPRLPVEFSPSTPSRFPFKSQKKGRCIIEAAARGGNT
ncbi:hypothetical protein Vadar_002819 [Vaccinium darrowii]|uniref:Uncharacterized protein n=1 Tax=Vaccinium darrowii TaxID=229202 RepID=A0ACB7YK02_9ERIC|nr:hypothetical protein Vadar_002819 [Vaccinium darrowii]